VAVRRTDPKGDPDMKHTAIAALGAAVIASLAASAAAEAASINFNFSALNGSILHNGGSLGDSTFLDFGPDVIELVTSVGPGDDSGLIELVSTITLTGAHTPLLNNAIVYGSAPGPLKADVVLTWPMVAPPGTDTFTETLTTVTSISPPDQKDPDFINVSMTGTVSDSMGLFNNTPVLLTLTATLAGGNIPSVAFSNSTTGVTPSIPEPSTWEMMALGFAALGYAGFRKRLNFGRTAGNVTPSAPPASWAGSR
jgi:hypothetical protein